MTILPTGLSTFSVHVKLLTCTYTLLLPSDGSAAQYNNSSILQIFITTVMTLNWIANEISLWPAMVKTCDGIGGTAKWLRGWVTLQSPLEVQIVSVRQLFDWCMCNIQHIALFFVTAAVIDSHRTLLNDIFYTSWCIP